MIKIIKYLTPMNGISTLTKLNSAGIVRKMTSNLLVIVAMAGMVGLMAGCGGGGGDATVVNGTVSKGILYPGTVTIFAVNEGVKASSELITVQTDRNGKFSADLGSYEGPIVIEATGEYTDEASTAVVTIAAANPLRAAIYDVGSLSNGKRCAVTPLTDLAYSLMAGSPLTNENIEAANERIAGIFKLTDIIWVEPVRPDAAVMGSSSVTVEQQVYTIALATLSQMAKDANGGAPASFNQIRDILESFKKDLAASPDGGLVSANTVAFTAALGTVTSSTLSGFDDASTKLENVSRSEFRLTLSAGTAPSGTLIGGIQGTIILPAGTSVRTEGSTEAVRGGMILALGNTASSMAGARYTAATRTLNYALLNGSGFSGGDFATLQIDVQTGVSVTAADFALSGSNVIDTNRNALNIAISGK